MSMNLAQLTSLVEQVSNIYAERNQIARDNDWFVIKLQEELGELTAEYLRLTGRGRMKAADADSVQTALEDETADLFAMLLLFARNNQIDLESALQRKWFKYLPEGY